MEKDRRILSLLLPTEISPEERPMYYTVKNGAPRSDGRAFRFFAKSTILLDGYYNVFDYAAYRRSTCLDQMEYVLVLRGDLSVSLFLSRSARNQKGYEDLLLVKKECNLAEKGEIRIPFSLSELEGKGVLYLSLEARSDGEFFEGYLCANSEPLRDVKIGVVITTYRRESYVKSNVGVLSRDLPQQIFSLFVIDNGNTISPEDIKGARLIPSKNLGGSGGFTRGIMEIMRENDFTHVLLTDDDIRFESEIFLRVAAILRYATDPEKTLVGASMLVLDEPYSQYEFGARWNGRSVISQNARLDLRDRASLLANAGAPTVDYAAWWFNCLPVSLPKRVGLPFPFFIKIDDVEYGLRAGISPLLVNGIGVLHESFERKYSPLLEYYSKRNELILNALYRPKSAFLLSLVLLFRAVAKQLVLQRYFTLDLVRRAFDDFLAGAVAFQRMDGERLHVSLRSQGEKRLTREELSAMGYDLSAFSPTRRVNKLREILTLNGQLLPTEKNPYRVVDLTQAKPSHFYRARRVVQFDPFTQSGFVTEQKRGMLLRAACLLIKYFFKLLFHHGKAARSFRREFPRIISEQAWRERLGIADGAPSRE